MSHRYFVTGTFGVRIVNSLPVTMIMGFVPLQILLSMDAKCV